MRAVASARARASWATGATRVERRRVRARAGKTASGGYEARNEFVIPSGDGAVVKRFEEEMALRVRVAKEANEYAFEQTWASKEAYEAYMNTPARRRSHLTVGVYQRLPKISGAFRRTSRRFCGDLKKSMEL
ncbi:hypothetical protein BE221DRAFT_161748 [Ostreococcus tauri]|uniref:ABM domain-containing protein n=1 Tax=Ostreococcus tauri TaxID=70448 RepID=A0A1Y5IF71_OSTTA|nr:hypothetical protein BE221DRAFT_161748 [Ostreococcus tauri]